MPFDDQSPYTIHYLNGTTQQVDGGDPENYLTSYTLGPGQNVHETGGMPAPPPGHNDPAAGG